MHKLASREYADEFVVLAVALELSIRIIVITYGPTVTAQDASRTIYWGEITTYTLCT